MIRGGMTMDDDEMIRLRLESHRERLAVEVEDACATDQFEILDVVPVLWSGWECDSGAGLVRLPDGAVRIVFIDGVGSPDRRTPLQVLEERLKAYGEVADRTRAFIASAKAAGAE